MKNNVVLIGGGGHSLVCYDVVCQHRNLNLVGFIDVKPDTILSEIGCKYLGNDTIINDLINKNYSFFISIGQIKSPKRRIEIYNNISNLGGSFINLISNFSYVSPIAHIDYGTIVMNGSVINAKAKIGKNCIINTNVTIEHEVVIESNVHVAPNATILGNVYIEEGCFIGAGSIIREGVTIKKHTVLPAGKKVMYDMD